jgi:hypothetical protein
MNLQKAYDLDIARRDIGKNINRIAQRPQTQAARVAVGRKDISIPATREKSRPTTR